MCATNLRQIRNSLIVITLFAIAMAFNESAVVIYLRKIYFPNGFGFPMPIMEKHLGFTEIGRELATLIILLTVSYLSGRDFITRFASFLYAFAIWDIFYYIFLKIILNWPKSFFTDDVLFLIPVVWIGPVIAPVILAGLMILLAFLIFHIDNKGTSSKILAIEWTLLVSGSLISISAFIWDYSKFILAHYSFAEIWVYPTSETRLNIASTYIPGNFNWLLFCLGAITISSGIFHLWKRTSQTRS